LRNAEEYLKKITQTAKDRKSEKFEFLALVLEAGIKAYKDGWKEADRCFEKAVEFFKAAGDKRSLAYAYAMYGRISKEKGFRNKAEKNRNKATKLFKELKLAHKCK
jgi:uncharacterized protein HemY